MASSPMQIDELAQTPARKGGQKAARPPITANPAFPWVVALWFAALLGIGSLIVPSTLLDRISAAAGLAAIVPMAAPPLGFTAKALIALVGTLAGGALGLALARKIVAPEAVRAAKARPRKPVIATSEIGEPGLEDDMHDDLAARTASGRRRALTIEEDEGPSDFLTARPLPDVHESAPASLPVSKDIVPKAAIEATDKEEAQRVEIEEPHQLLQPAPPVTEAFEDDDEPLELEECAELVEESGREAEAFEGQEPPRQELAPTAAADKPVVAVNYTQVPEARATATQPLPFSPPSMARIEDEQDDQFGESDFAAEQTFAPEKDTGPESEDTVSDKQIFQGQGAAEHDVAAEVVEAAALKDEGQPTLVSSESADDSDANADGEGLVQLVQRLGSTLERHREWAAEKATAKADRPAPEPHGAEHQPVPDEFDPAAAEDVSQAMAAYFGAPAAAPAATVVPEQPEEVVQFEDVVGEDAPAFAAPAEAEAPRQRYESFRGTIAAVDLDDDDDEGEDDFSEIAASFTLPLTSPEEPAPAPRPAFDQPPPSAGVISARGDRETDVDEEESLELGEFPANPFKRNAEEFVRVEEPEPVEGDTQPAVLFPNQQARKPAAPSGPAPAPASTQTPGPASAPRAFDPPAGESDTATQRGERPRPSNDDNDRALREALINLQRMGK